MCRQLIMAFGLLTCIGPIVRCENKYGMPEPTASNDPVVTIGLDRVSLTTGKLEVHYQIRNASAHDVWICESMNVGGLWPVETYLASDEKTLLVQRRLNLPMEGAGEQPSGRYTRLHAGETRKELFTVRLPVRHRRVLSGGRPSRPLEYASRLSLEVGYYDEDLPAMIQTFLRQAEDALGSRSGDFPPVGPGLYMHYFGGLLYFAANGETLRNRSEEVSIPYTRQALKGEQTLRLDIEDLRIPYWEQWEELVAPDLTTCTRLQVEFKPTALDFFFPYLDERELLDPTEEEQLRSLRNLVITDQRLLRAFADDVSKPMDNTFVRDCAVADVVCYRGSEQETIVRVYDGSQIVNDKGQVFRYDTFRREGGLLSVRRFAPQIEPLDLRVQCAANLEDLWHRLRAYHRVPLYPGSATWCDDVVNVFMGVVGMRPSDAKRPFECPSARGGQCQYAMNPECKADSPADMVLLFETRAGWNQHGGPELFSLDNHDAKGGLVLLNDGKVKFIRTEEELKQLRWK